MAAATKEPKKVKKGFKMPHLFWIMIGLLFVSSLLTYVIPAGQFMTDPETGKILGDQFQYLGTQTPVSPLQVLLLLIDGLVKSSLIGWTVMVSGATVAIVMGTGAFDEFMNWAIYKLKDKARLHPHWRYVLSDGLPGRIRWFRFPHRHRSHRRYVR